MRSRLDNAINEIEKALKGVTQFTPTHIKQSLDIIIKHYKPEISIFTQDLSDLQKALQNLSSLEAIKSALINWFNSINGKSLHAVFGLLIEMAFSEEQELRIEKSLSSTATYLAQELKLNLKPPYNPSRFRQDLEAISNYFKFKVIASEENDDPVPVLGTTPIIPSLEKYTQAKDDKNNILVIGLSGLRLLEIALRLSNGIKFPIILNIDMSKNVFDFWCNLRAYATKYNTQADFLNNILHFIKENSHLMRREDIPYLKKYLAALIEIHGFELFRQTIQESIVLQNIWQSFRFMGMIKGAITAYQFTSTYFFASNIVDLIRVQISIEEAEIILANMQLFSPKLTIHSAADYVTSSTGEKFLQPVNVYLETDSSCGDSVETLIENLHSNNKNLTPTTKDAILLNAQSLSKKSGSSSNFGDKIIGVFHEQKQTAINKIQSRARALFDAGKYDEAAKAYTLAVQHWRERQPRAKMHLAISLYNLGSCYFKAGNHLEAEPHLQEAAKLADSNSEVQDKAQLRLMLCQQMRVECHKYLKMLAVDKRLNSFHS